MNTDRYLIQSDVSIANKPHSPMPLFNKWTEPLRYCPVKKYSEEWAMLTINRYAHALAEYNMKKRLVQSLVDHPGSNEMFDKCAKSDTPTVITNEWHPYHMIWCNSAFKQRYNTTMEHMQGSSLKTAVKLVCNYEETHTRDNRYINRAYTQFMDMCNGSLYTHNDMVSCVIPVVTPMNHIRSVHTTKDESIEPIIVWKNTVIIISDPSDHTNVRVFVSTFTYE